MRWTFRAIKRHRFCGTSSNACSGSLCSRFITPTADDVGDMTLSRGWSRWYSSSGTEAIATVLRAQPVLVLLLENEPAHHAVGSILTRQSSANFHDRDSAIDRLFSAYFVAFC